MTSQIRHRRDEAGSDLDEVMVGSWYGRVPRFGQDVLVVLRVYEHAQSEAVLRLLLLRLVLPFPSSFLIVLHFQDRLHVYSNHLRNSRLRLVTKKRLCNKLFD